MYSFSYFFHYGLSHDVEYSSLWYTVGLCCLSILYIIVCKIYVSLMISDIEHLQSKTSQQRKAQDQLVSLANSTKHLKKS